MWEMGQWNKIRAGIVAGAIAKRVAQVLIGSVGLGVPEGDHRECGRGSRTK